MNLLDPLTGRIAHVGVGFDPGGEERLAEIIKAELAKPATPPAKE